MYRNRGVSASIKPPCCCAVSYPNFLLIINSHIDHNYKVSGFWRVVKTIVMFNFFQEDYYEELLKVCLVDASVYGRSKISY